MPAAFPLVLDTEAPIVSWQAPGSTGLGHELRVGYALNEPQIAEARLVLADSSELAMQVEPGVLRVGIPADARPGPAQVRARARDEVWNEGLAYSPLIALTTLITGGRADRGTHGRADENPRGRADAGTRRD